MLASKNAVIAIFPSSGFSISTFRDFQQRGKLGDRDDCAAIKLTWIQNRLAGQRLQRFAIDATLGAASKLSGSSRLPLELAAARVVMRQVPLD